MNKEELIIQLNNIGIVDFCNELDGQFCISINNVIESQEIYNNYKAIIEEYVTPFYSNIIAEVMESNSIKSVYN